MANLAHTAILNSTNQNTAGRNMFDNLDSFSERVI